MTLAFNMITANIANISYTSEACQFCDSRIDSLGLCACGAGGA